MEYQVNIKLNNNGMLTNTPYKMPTSLNDVVLRSYLFFCFRILMNEIYSFFSFKYLSQEFYKMLNDKSLID